MGTTSPPQDRTPAWLPTADIPVQRQGPRAPVVPAPRAAAPALPRAHRPIATYVVAAGLVIGAVDAFGAVRTETTPSTPTTPPAASDGFVANVSVPGRALTSFGDGTWQVGVDVEAGTYRTTGAVDATCRHALQPARTDGTTTGGTAGRGPATIVLTEADGWFDTSGCATWKRAG